MRLQSVHLFAEDEPVRFCQSNARGGVHTKEMKKRHLLQHLSQKCGIPRKKVVALLDQLLNVAVTEVEAKGMFNLPGFGRIRKVPRKARRGRNPRNGEALEIPAKMVVRFRVSTVAQKAILENGFADMAMGSEWPADLRRSHLRIRPNRPLLAHAQNYLGRVRDISFTGAFIESERPPLPGQKLSVTFWVDVENLVRLEAVVRRVEALRGMGVEFLQINGAGVRLLCAYWSVMPPQASSERRAPFSRIKPKQTMLAEFPRVNQRRVGLPRRLSRVRDISPVGAFIELHRSLPLGQRVAVKLWLNGFGPIPCDARIRRVAEGHGVGVEFMRMSESGFDRLQGYLLE